MQSTFLTLLGLLPVLINAQLSGSVGPLVDYTTKAQNKTCDVTNYGAVADGETDIADALLSAWADCATEGLVYIPPGEYSMKTAIALKHGQSTSIQLDSIITRGADLAYQMILVRDTSDFELFSCNSKGAIQGYGYEYLQSGNYGVRFFRFQDVVDFSVHGFAAIDSPSYYFVFDACSNGEIYNILVRGVVVGMTDAFDT
jgi:rhamnogalacturonan hydrolase